MFCWKRVLSCRHAHRYRAFTLGTGVGFPRCSNMSSLKCYCRRYIPYGQQVALALFATNGGAHTAPTAITYSHLAVAKPVRGCTRPACLTATSTRNQYHLQQGDFWSREMNFYQIIPRDDAGLDEHKVYLVPLLLPPPKGVQRVPNKFAQVMMGFSKK